MSSIKARSIKPTDRAEWLRMRCALWPGDDAGHAKSVDAFFAGDLENPLDVIVVDRPLGGLSGFAELAIRPFAEGCLTSDVAYLEGWWVDEDLRREGVGRVLIAAAEDWARRRGCSELASDTEHDNKISTKAHMSCGFEDAGLVRCFRKVL